jgi:malonyl-CoA O-methyltransferase
MNDDLAGFALDAVRARRRFERAAPSYEGAAVLHAQVRAELLERLGLTTLKPAVVLDLGAGTGQSSRALVERYPQALVVALDWALPMLQAARRRQPWLKRFARLGADAARLPLRSGSVDLIVSNLLLQWCDPDAVFAEMRRVITPNGLVTFTSFGPDTLKELRRAWTAVDAAPHVHPFIDMHDLGDALVRAGFAQPVLDVERYTLSYADFDKLGADLKALGATNALRGRRRGLTGRSALASLRAAYERERQDGRLPATFEVVYAHAWAPVRKISADDGSVVSLEEVKRQLRARRGL